MGEATRLGQRYRMGDHTDGRSLRYGGRCGGRDRVCEMEGIMRPSEDEVRDMIRKRPRQVALSGLASGTDARGFDPPKKDLFHHCMIALVAPFYFTFWLVQKITWPKP